MLEYVEFPEWHGVKHTAYRVTGEDTHLLTPDRFDIGDGWTLSPLDRGEVMQLAWLNGEFDFAVPQPWYDAHIEEIKEHGGWVVWHCPESRPFMMGGTPVFGDYLLKRARFTARTLLKHALRKQHGRTTVYR